MNDLNRWFFAATVRRRSRYSCSVSAGGSWSGFLSRMLAGSAASIKRVERARADDAKHLGLLRLVRADVALFERVRRIDGHVVRGLLHQFGVLIIIEQIVDFVRIAELDVEQPRAVRVLVDQFRLASQVCR